MKISQQRQQRRSVNFSTTAKSFGICILLMAVLAATVSISDAASVEKGSEKTPDPNSRPRRSFEPYCGIYCLYAASKFFDANTAPEKLLKPEYIGSRRGSSLAELKKAAEDNGLYAECIGNLTISDLRKCAYPVILHVKFAPTSSEYGHYRLFLGSETGGAKLFDPPSPVELVPYHKLAPLWDGTGLIVSAEPINLGRVCVSARRRFALCIAICTVIILAVHYGRKKLFALIPHFSRIQLIGLSIVQTGGMVMLALLGAMVYHFANDAGFLAHANATTSVQQAHLGSFVPKVSKNEVEQLLNSDTVIIDARYKGDFEAGYLDGAISIPVDANDTQRQKAMADIEKDAKIVIYCQSKGCPFAQKVTVKLKADGFNNISIYKGGWNDWKSNGKRQ